jgi:hypothetical protein
MQEATTDKTTSEAAATETAAGESNSTNGATADKTASASEPVSVVLPLSLIPCLGMNYELISCRLFSRQLKPLLLTLPLQNPNRHRAPRLLLTLRYLCNLRLHLRRMDIEDGRKLQFKSNLLELSSRAE